MLLYAYTKIKQKEMFITNEQTGNFRRALETARKKKRQNWNSRMNKHAYNIKKLEGVNKTLKMI